MGDGGGLVDLNGVQVAPGRKQEAHKVKHSTSGWVDGDGKLGWVKAFEVPKRLVAGVHDATNPREAIYQPRREALVIPMHILGIYR